MARSKPEQIWISNPMGSVSKRHGSGTTVLVLFCIGIALRPVLISRPCGVFILASCRPHICCSVFIWGKGFGSGGIRTHAPEETGALNQRLRPLGHATLWLLGQAYSHNKRGAGFLIPPKLVSSNYQSLIRHLFESKYTWPKKRRRTELCWECWRQLKCKYSKPRNRLFLSCNRKSKTMLT